MSRRDGTTRVAYASAYLSLYLFLSLIVVACQAIVTPSMAQSLTNIGSYGELHYNEVVTGLPKKERVGKLYFSRFAFILNHQFNDRIDFHSETDLNHVSVDSSNTYGGSLDLEQAYFDFLIRSHFNIRAGLILVPVGIVNINHDPTTFNGVERPNVEKYIVPSTWREIGGGFYGSFDHGLRYQLYGLAGLDPAGITGADGIRNARQNGVISSMDNWAIAARLDYTIADNLKTGVSYYFSTLSNSATVGGGQLNGANISLADVHILYSQGNLKVRGLYVLSHIENAKKINLYYNKQIGASQYGAYLEVGFNLLGWLAPSTWQQLIPFVRYEKYDTNYRTGGYSHNDAYDRYETTFGITYKPIQNVALKADYQLLYSYNAANLRQLNLGIGYSF